MCVLAWARLKSSPVTIRRCSQLEQDGGQPYSSTDSSSTSLEVLHRDLRRRSDAYQPLTEEPITTMKKRGGSRNINFIAWVEVEAAINPKSA